MSGQSMLLTEYYRSLQNWVNKGCPIAEPYYQVGICMNVAIFVRERLKNTPNIWKSSQINLILEMRNQFIGEGLSRNFPFNNDIRDANEEDMLGTTYKNVKRLDWIRNHA